MRRRRTQALACAALAAATFALPAGAPAQDPTSALPSETAPASSAVPAGTLPGAVSTTAPPATATAPPTTAAPAATSAAPASATSGPSADDGSDKTAILLLAVLGAVLLAAVLAWAAARWWAYEAPWWIRWRHATAEAGWRTSAAWAEFKDWFRLGR